MEDQASVLIARYRCLLLGRLDEYMRRALNEMLTDEETRLAKKATDIEGGRRTSG
jgi:hypothetical protein